MFGIIKRLFRRTAVSSVHRQTRPQGLSAHLSKHTAAGQGLRKILAGNARTARGWKTHGTKPAPTKPAAASKPRGLTKEGKPRQKPGPKPKAKPQPKPTPKTRKRTSSVMRAGAATKSKRSFGKALKVDTRHHMRAATKRRAAIMAIKDPAARKKAFLATVSKLKAERKAKAKAPKIDKDYYRKARKAIPKSKKK